MSLDADALLDRRRLKRRLAIWRLLAILFLGVLAAIIIDQETDVARPEHVARLTLVGTILDDPYRDDLLAEVRDDTSAKALIVYIDSPGGTTTGAESLYHALRAVAAEKPVVAVAAGMAASGGYIAALGADRIFARETTITGSIGVIIESQHFKELMDKVGVSIEEIRSGALKAQPSPYGTMTPPGRQMLQSVVDDSAAWFFELVSKRRDLPMDKVREFADGRIYTGRQALKVKLIDELGGEAAARAWLASSKAVGEDLPVYDIDLVPPKSWLAEIVGDELAQAAANGIEKALKSNGVSLDGLKSVWHPSRM